MKTYGVFLPLLTRFTTQERPRLSRNRAGMRGQVRRTTETSQGDRWFSQPLHQYRRRGAGEEGGEEVKEAVGAARPGAGQRAHPNNPGDKIEFRHKRSHSSHRECETPRIRTQMNDQPLTCLYSNSGAFEIVEQNTTNTLVPHHVSSPRAKKATKSCLYCLVPVLAFVQDMLMPDAPHRYEKPTFVSKFHPSSSTITSARDLRLSAQVAIELTTPSHHHHHRRRHKEGLSGAKYEVSKTPCDAAARCNLVARDGEREWSVCSVGWEEEKLSPFRDITLMYPHEPLPSNEKATRVRSLLRAVAGWQRGVGILGSTNNHNHRS
ncbi:hypothetical protein O3P69_016324 [Scylla paramamosain]|uniref:Uncharacterized protein n=1 Tax=Scylla paramamosain TaxID=85552 RepID=A0AAW0TCN3_SCYPA